MTPVSRRSEGKQIVSPRGAMDEEIVKKITERNGGNI